MFNSLNCFYFAVLLWMPNFNTICVNEQIFLLKTAHLTISLENKELLALFRQAEYNEDDENLSIETATNIHSVLIFNSEGVLDFMLPVGSTKVKLGKSMFGSGLYELGFNFQGMDETAHAKILFK